MGEPRLDRLTLAVILTALAEAWAGSGSDAELSRFVDSLRSEASRRQWRIVLGDEPEVTPQELVVEYRYGYPLDVYGILKIHSHGTDCARGERIEIRYTQPDIPRSDRDGPPFKVETVDLPRSAHERLVIGLARLARARAENFGASRFPAREVDPQGARPHDTQVFVSHGGKVLMRGWFLPGYPDKILDCEFDDCSRSMLCFEFLKQALASWVWVEASGQAPVVARRFAKELAGLEGFRRDLRTLAIAELGFVEARPVISGLDPQNETSRRALRHLDVVAACEKATTPPRVLMDTIWEAYEGLQDWAEEILRRRYPKEYRVYLRRAYVAASVDGKLRRLCDLEAFDAKDHSLATLASREPDSLLRVEAARILGDRGVLLRTSAERSFRKDRQFCARLSALEYLADERTLRSGRGEVEAHLLRIASEEGEDVRVRSVAIRQLGVLGSESLAEFLLRLATAPPPRDPVYLHNPWGRPAGEVPREMRVQYYLGRDDLRFAAAEALGWLRVDSAVDELVALVDAVDGPRADAIGGVVALALGRIGGEQARTALKGMDERVSDEALLRRCRALCEAVTTRDTRMIIELCRGPVPALAQFLRRTHSKNELNGLSTTGLSADQRRAVSLAVELLQADGG